jgi:hypothetical protein
MKIPGFVAAASLYRNTHSYRSGHIRAEAARGIAPQQIPIGGLGGTTGFVSWCINQVCVPEYNTCTNNVPACVNACYPNSLGACEARCYRLPPQRRDDCLFACPGQAFNRCHTRCATSCDAAYSNCVNFCYNPTITPQPVPIIGR